MALGNTTGTITAGRDSLVASLGNVMATVNAAGNSFAWAYGDLIGTYHATSGFAGGVSLGDSNHTLLAGTDAFAVAGGRLNTLLQAGDYAYVWSGGDLSGVVVAGASATAISFGKVGLALTAGRDALVAAVGDVDGMYSAARDLAVASYGRISILGQAGRDVPWLWARGDVEGTYLVGRHVGEVFSYGNVFLALMAGQSVGGVGSVGSVQAWGSVSGVVTAADSIDYLRVGDQVTAILSAASVATPIEYDTTITLDYPYPGTPESPMPGVLAAAAVQFGEIQAARAAKLVEIAGVKTAHLQERATVAGKLAEAKSEVYSEGQQELAERVEAKEEGIDALKKDLARAQDEAQADEAEVRRLADAGLQVAKGEKAADERVGQEKYDKARAETAKADSDAAADKAEMEKSREEELARFDQKREEEINWPEEHKAAVKDWFLNKLQDIWQRASNPGGALVNDLASGLESWNEYVNGRLTQVWEHAMANGDSQGWAIYEVIGITAYDSIPGVMFLYQAFTGEDPVTLEKYNAGDRWLKGIIGGVQLGITIVSGAGGLAAMRGACGGYIFARCFTEGHWILVLDTGHRAATKENTLVAKSQDALGIWEGAAIAGAVLVVVVGATLQEVDFRRRKKRAEELLDACFGEWDDEAQEKGKGLKNMLPPTDDNADSIASVWEKSSSEEFWNDGSAVSDETSVTSVATLAPPTTAVALATRAARPAQSPKAKASTAMTKRTNFSRTRPRRNWGWLGGSCLGALLLLSILLPWNAWFSSPTPTKSETVETSASTPDEPRWTQKRIEEIRKDDIVLAFNTETGLPEPRRVVQVFQRLSFDLRLLDFETESGDIQRFETTDEHPFWVPLHRNYVDAKDLQVGDEVQSPEGERQKLVRTERELHPEGILVYNFEVEGLHNYFVLAPDRNGPPVLVHNANGYGPARDALGRFTSKGGGYTASAARGIAAHKNYRNTLGRGYDFEVTLPSGKRADAVDFENRIVRELKPNNPRAIQDGRRQLERYRQELEVEFGGTWTSFLDTYEP